METSLHSIRVDPNFPVSDEFNEKIMDCLRSNGLCENHNGSYLYTTIDFQLYTLYHKQAFISTVLEFDIGLITPDILHDTDKLVLYGMMDWKNASGLHKDYSFHHYGSLHQEFDALSAAIDYECARITKGDKQMNAYETIKKKRAPESFCLFQPYLERFGLWSPDHYQFTFKKWSEIVKGTDYRLRLLIDRNCNCIQDLSDDIRKNGFDAALTRFNSY